MDKSLLTLTHSSRLTDLNLCSINYFNKRYYFKPDRLNNLPYFERLKPVSEFNSYVGSVSFFILSFQKDLLPEINYIGTIKLGEKAQQAVQVSEKEMIIGYESKVALYRFKKDILSYNKINDSEWVQIREFHNPLFPGIHTIFPLDAERVVLSCAAPDAAIVFNYRSGRVECILRMPEEDYGRNYDLNDTTDLRKHYIHNDCQTTHINSAYPIPGTNEMVVSALIPGSVGIFNLKNGSYREVTKGFVGCHGARVNDKAQIYFADSVNGVIVFLDEDGSIDFRFGVYSRWLHDVQQIRGNIYALSLADKNEMLICDIKQDKILYSKKFITFKSSWEVKDSVIRILKKIPFWYGNSTQFLSYSLRQGQ